MANTKTLRIKRALIVGLGSIGLRHLRLLRERLPDIEIMVLRHSLGADIDEGADHSTNSIEDAIKFAPDIAIIASPATFHSSQAIPLANAGIHTLVEKPMAATTCEAEKMLSAANTAGAVLQVGYNLRFLESLCMFKSTLDSAKIGRVFSVRAEVGQYLPDWRPGRDWRSSVSARAELGGGVLMELSHELDFLHWIFGDVKSARGWTGHQGGLQLQVEDTVHAVLEFTSSFPKGNNGVAPVASVSLDFARRDTVRVCTAIGEEGTLTWNGITSQVVFIGPDQKPTVLFDKKPDRDFSYRAQLEAFLTAVENKDSATANSDDGLRVMRTIAAIKQSHENSGAAISLDH